MTDQGDRIEPFSPRRQGTVGYMRTAGRRSSVHGLMAVDVTEARRRIDTIEAETGESLSFTAFLVFCLAQALNDHPTVNAYRDWRGRVHVFEDVDVNVLVETTVDGERMGVPHVVRTANERSVRSIHDEIRAAQESQDPTELSPLAKLGLRLPGFLRRLVWRLPQWFPRRWKDSAGAVAVTSVGMFGEGGGWEVSPTNYTLQVTVGGISEKPRVVDGAPATRFTQRLGELIEDASGLETQQDT
jgi:pyruvate/2-oxoglutarate dehydrogenase complex dihydrolipoamide acyltransferase (E2) component